MMEKIALSLSLFWRVVWCLFPIFAEAASTSNQQQSNAIESLNNESLRETMTSYSDLILVSACLFCLFAGSMVGYFYPTPEYGAKPLPAPVKILISVTGGFLAFLYYIETKQVITPAVCVWVAGVSFVAPAILHLIHAAAIKFLGMRWGVSEADLKKIKKSFWKDGE